MSLAILFHFLCAQHVSDINISIIRGLLRPLNNPNLLILYEQYYIQTLYREGKLILEQNPGETKPLFQTAINPQPPHTSWTEQLCFSLQNEYHQKLPAPKAPTHNELRYVQSQFHITKYLNKALNTKQPMKNTTHKRTQWSQSITDSDQNQLKYTYQLHQGDKTHHTKHTTIHRKITLMPDHPSLQNKTTDVVIHQHSRKLLKMDILMSETCCAHTK